MGDRLLTKGGRWDAVTSWRFFLTLKEGNWTVNIPMRRRIDDMSRGVAGSRPAIAPTLGYAALAAGPGSYLSAQSFSVMPPTAEYDVAPKVIDSYAPYFPHAEFVNHKSGFARIGLTVLPNGKPRDFVMQAATTRGFADEAIYALHKWRFAPAKKHGQPVPVHIAIPFYFERK